jgi:indolepyruvate ferredoxin oxidoreductase alpha subunit
MPEIDINAPGKIVMLIGNEAIARGALEAGVGFVASYPGTPSSEILPALAKVAKRRGLYAEWSINEMVAMMNATAAAMSGIRAMATMKQNGTNVAMDFIATQVRWGVRGGAGLVLVNCDDPGGRNSPNEQDTRSVAKMLDIPMLEPGDFQEAKDMTMWLFDLSEELDTLVMLRVVAKISHTSGNVTLGELSSREQKVRFGLDPPRMVPGGSLNPHARLHEKLEKAKEKYESSPFNRYVGPDKPELLIITCGASWLHSLEAVRLLGLQDKVGVLKLGTIWPLPEKLVTQHLAKSGKVLFVEEVDPFLERSVMELAASRGPTGPRPFFYGKRSEHIPAFGELNPDTVIQAVTKIMDITYEPRPVEYGNKVEAAAKEEVILRIGTLCPGCPHRASYWAIHKALKLDGQDGFATSDNGCMSAGLGPGGFFVAKTHGAMGAGAGLADGFGKLGQFGFNQPVLGSVGDSTFFHAGIPPLINAVWNRSNMALIIYDNSATAMTGFQPHPGTGMTAMGDQGQTIPPEDICHALGIRVEICDPFDLDKTTETLLDVMHDEANGPRVVIMRHECELQRARRETQPYLVRVDAEKCLGESCGCDRLCTRIFRCPGLRWNEKTGKAEIDEVTCCGCGLCIDVCPQGAIVREELVSEDKELQEEVVGR